jgi:large subunit ribosomal protein L21
MSGSWRDGRLQPARVILDSTDGGRLRSGDRPLASIPAMYAVIASGGKQEKVAEGQQVRVELLDAEDGSDVSLTPVMVVDGSTVFATPDELKGASVTGKVIGRTKGPKINGYTFKKRTNQHRRYGHRQNYHVVEITSISI